MEEKKKQIEAEVSKIDDITQAIDIPEGISLPKDVNQLISEYYSIKHEMGKLQ